MKLSPHFPTCPHDLPNTEGQKMKTIDISEELYRRLSTHASGFGDTPANVIERILDTYESSSFGLDTTNSPKRDGDIQPATNLEIVYVSGSEDIFKRELLIRHRAYIKLFYTNGRTAVKEWNTSDFGEKSSVSNNLRSGYLRRWRQRGITKAVLSVNLDDLTMDKRSVAHFGATNSPKQDGDIQPATNLEIIYVSGSEDIFKDELLIRHRAYIKLFYTNGKTAVKEWNASKFRKKSSVGHNLRAGYLNNWRLRGITKAVISINRNDLEDISMDNLPSPA